MRSLTFVLTAAALLALAACAAPSPENAAAAPASRPAPAAAAGAAPAPPSQRGGAQADAAPAVKIDRSCKTDADCAVKDVGNCCGRYPACVNKASPTDPEGVRAQCQRSGMMSTCGFREIQGCQCVQGQCQARGMGVEVR